MFLSMCDYSGVLRTMKILYYVLMITKIVVPIVLIIMGFVKYFKVATGNASDEFGKTTSLLMKNAIAAILVYLIPSFITAIFNSMVDYESVSNNYNSCNICLSEPDTCTYLISVAEYNEEQASLEESKKQAEDNNKAVAEKKEKDEAMNKALGDYNRKRAEKTKNSNSDGSYNSNLDYSTGDLTLDWNDVTKISNVTASELTEALTNCTSFSGKAKNFLPYVNDLITAERKHNVNVFYLIGIYALESGWLTSNLAVNCNNIGGVKYVSSKSGNGYSQCPGTSFAKYSTMGMFIDEHASLLENAYLTPGGSYYEGTTPDAVVIHYCPGAGSEYTDTVRSIGTTLFQTIA